MRNLIATDYSEVLEAEQDQAEQEQGLNASARESLPEEAQCSLCDLFDIQHPDIRRILNARDPTERLLNIAKCRCPAMQREKEAENWRRWAQANLPSDAPGGRSFDGFRISAGNKGMLEAAQEFAAGLGPDLLVLVGSNGNGKSHLLEATCRASLARGLRVRYEVGKRYLDRLRHTFHDGNEHQDLADLTLWYQSFEVLALDDVGMEKAPDFAATEITDLVDERMHYRRRTMLATNKTRDEMAEHLGERLASRMYSTNERLGSVKLIVSDAGDYRKNGGR